MKTRTKVILGVLAISVGTCGIWTVAGPSGSATEAEARTVTVERGDVMEKAVANGTIEPRAEVEVKSKVSGMVRRQFAEAGDFVEEGAPLLEIRPDPTPLELVEARRDLQMQQISLETLDRDLARQQALQEAGIIPDQELEGIKGRRETAALQMAAARERLALLEDGRVVVDDQPLESVVRAPVSGFILDRLVQVGDQVAPLSAYQEGTTLFHLADMQDLVFRGDVDEIDVGRVEPGMEVLIRVGALPNDTLHGRVARVALKGTRADQATVFPVEIILTDLGDAVLRAGFSATADVVVRRAENALLLPERAIRFSGDTASAAVQLPNGRIEERVLGIGVGDGLNVEILSGLQEGDVVLEDGSGPARSSGTSG
jgi:HlyD family secretion protein